VGTGKKGGRRALEGISGKSNETADAGDSDGRRVEIKRPKSEVIQIKGVPQQHIDGKRTKEARAIAWKKKPAYMVHLTMCSNNGITLANREKHWKQGLDSSCRFCGKEEETPGHTCEYETMCKVLGEWYRTIGNSSRVPRGNKKEDNIILWTGENIINNGQKDEDIMNVAKAISMGVPARERGWTAVQTGTRVREKTQRLRRDVAAEASRKQ